MSVAFGRPAVAAWLLAHRGHTVSGPSERRLEPGTFTWSCPCASASLTMPAGRGDEDGASMRRASGDCTCTQCGLPYRRHPLSWHRSNDGFPYLHRLCDGGLVHL